MAIGWLAVLKLVPWGDVIENAPKVAQGAKKLWDKVGKKSVASSIVVPPAAPAAMATQPPDLAQLQAQVIELEAAVVELHQQMFESSDLIKSLAEQNSQLVKRVEAHRRRLLGLAWLLLGLAVAFVFKLF